MTDYLEWYYYEHYERIKLTIEMLDKIVEVSDEVLDLGSIFPLSTYWFALYKKAKIICADLYPKNWKLSDELYSTTVDLNETMLNNKGKGWRIINFQEVIEHLTCDLTQVRDRIIDALQPGGYLLAGYPLISVSARGKHGDVPFGGNLRMATEGGKETERPSFTETLRKEQVAAEHKREFLLGECESFFPLKRISSKVVFTIGYTRGTVLVLYRKE